MSSPAPSANRPVAFLECPGPLRVNLEQALEPDEVLLECLYSPAFATNRLSLPGSAFCVTNRRWLAVVESKDGPVTHQAAFGDTLLIELTIILLYGQLKLDYSVGGHGEACVPYFNTVRERLYHRAVERVLWAIRGAAAPQEVAHAFPGELEALPLKFRNYVHLYCPVGDVVAGFVHWPTLFGGFRRELAPAGVLVLTDRHLAVFAEEKSRAWFVAKRDEGKYGAIMTFIPRGNITAAGVREHPRFDALEVEVHGSHGAEVFPCFFPHGQRDAVSALVKSSASETWS
jgi:hypothetical protein